MAMTVAATSPSETLVLCRHQHAALRPVGKASGYASDTVGNGSGFAAKDVNERQ